MRKVSDFPLQAVIDDVSFIRRVRALSADSGRIRLSSHARVRMAEREISLREVVQTLRQGVLAEPAHPDIRGYWTGRMMYTHAGRLLHVVAQLRAQSDEFVLVITSF